MRLQVVARKSASSNGRAPADASPLDAARPPDAVDGGPDRDATENGSKDESFFEARPWLDSDSDDDFYSVRGDFTPSRGTTPNHQRQTPFSQGMPVDITKPSLVQKKQRLIELLQEKQHYDDEDDGATDVSSYLEDSAVHAEEHLKPSRKGGKVKKSSKPGCFPRSIWKHSFKMCMDTRKEQVHK
ncbi:hypothetical protein EJB05_37344 [Eragrostis curvula]|uniref:Uncharacterized protein n=1 Tax=Eragrostis curvula TaxID=38414 RepID=A0A5J9TSW4_9POAL|nr:hypothetical protein EJB05_37344 [Eragrostis curvula]